MTSSSSMVNEIFKDHNQCPSRGRKGGKKILKHKQTWYKQMHVSKDRKLKKKKKKKQPQQQQTIPPTTKKACCHTVK